MSFLVRRVFNTVPASEGAVIEIDIFGFSPVNLSIKPCKVAIFSDFVENSSKLIWPPDTSSPAPFSVSAAPDTLLSLLLLLLLLLLSLFVVPPVLLLFPQPASIPTAKIPVKSNEITFFFIFMLSFSYLFSQCCASPCMFIVLSVFLYYNKCFTTLIKITKKMRCFYTISTKTSHFHRHYPLNFSSPDAIPHNQFRRKPHIVNEILSPYQLQ